MADQELSDLGRPPRRTGITFGILIAVLATAVLIGVALVFDFVDKERARDLRAWSDRLNIVANSRVAAVNDWVSTQFGDLTALAQNASLQIYMTEIALSAGDKSKATAAAAQIGYLRNLLVTTAERAGFTGEPIGPDVNANVERRGVAGIALINSDGKLVVSTPNMPPLEGPLRDFVLTLPRGQRAASSIYPGPAGTPTMAFAAPVFAVQSENRENEQIGAVVGVKELGDKFYGLLKQPGDSARTAETVLVRLDGNVIEYLSPLRDGTPPLTRKLSTSTPNLAAAAALSSPNFFGIKVDYRGEPVLLTSRKVALVPWTLEYKIDRDEALADSDTRRTRLLTMFLLAIGVVAVAILAAWWHGSSRRARDAAHKFEALATKFRNQSAFLQLVTDSQPNIIFIIDQETKKLRFANRATADRAGVPASDLIGKPLAAVFGPEEAKRYLRHGDHAAETNEPVAAVDRVTIGDTDHVLQSEHIPLERTETEPAGILIVERDITAAVTERERRERTLRQLVKTLVAVVDRRDPYAANHSMRVAAVARAIAEEMGLDPVTVETADIVGNIMNLGKILVPEGVLTRAGSLSQDEMQKIRDSMQTTADLLVGIEFDGPVVASMRQLQEHWDGSGHPNGLKGEEIFLPARIVAVANAFVAMVSPRAYRPGIGFDQAIETLMSQVNKAFDRRVVAALVNYLDNRGGRERWAEFARAAGA